MQFMNCSTCQRVVQINNTGICLSCQRGFTGVDAEDVWKPPVKQAEDTQNASKIDELKARQKEIEEQLEEPQSPRKPKRKKK